MSAMTDQQLRRNREREEKMTRYRNVVVVKGREGLRSEEWHRRTPCINGVVR